MSSQPDISSTLEAVLEAKAPEVALQASLKQQYNNALIQQELAKQERRKRLLGEFVAKGQEIVASFMQNDVQPNLAMHQQVHHNKTRIQRLLGLDPRITVERVEGLDGWMIYRIPEVDKIEAPKEHQGFHGSGLALLNTGEVGVWEGLYKTEYGTSATLRRKLDDADMCSYDNYGRMPLEYEVPIEQDPAYAHTMSGMIHYGVRALENARADQNYIETRF